MKTVILNLGEKFNGMKIPIDISTFNFYGHIEGKGESDADARIGFVPTTEVGAEQLATDLRNLLRSRYPGLPVEKYAGMRIPDSYESDQRLRVWVRLPSGMAGMVNPAEFKFQSA